MNSNRIVLSVIAASGAWFMFGIFYFLMYYVGISLPLFWHVFVVSVGFMAGSAFYSFVPPEFNLYT